MTVNDNPTDIKQYIRFFLVADVITIIASMAIGVFLFRRYAIQEHIKTAKGVTEYAAEMIDIDRIPEFIEKGRDAAGYDETYAKLNRLTGIHPDVKFLYVLRMQEDGCVVAFDIDSGDVAGMTPGTVIDYEEAFLPYMDDLLAGRSIDPIISNDDWGYLLTVYTPAYDSNGKCQCYVAVDFSMGKIWKYVADFIIRVAVFLVCFGILVFIVRALFLNKHLFRPMKKIDAIAHHDALTGLLNNTAYEETVSDLEKQILSGGASFSIILVDVNFLKRVNDTYGHEKGNEYLVTNAKAIAELFGKENVYRVGGDEFTVVLRDRASLQAEDMVRTFKEIRAKADAQENEWELVRAAVGLAVYDPETDSDVESVFKRADSAMYEDKVAMKAERRD